MPTRSHALSATDAEGASHSPDDAAVFARRMAAHRSIRRYQDRLVEPSFIDRVLTQALAGSSSSGNLNMVSVIKTTDPARKAQLCALHSEQPMVLQAPLVLTFCADTHRTRAWLALRQARLNFGNLLGWHVAAFDAIILSQTVALAFESHCLGICYMSTTLQVTGEIAALLECPDHCLPVTSLVVGWPDETPPQRDRLPAGAWIHEERYARPTGATIERDYAEREQRGWLRYRSMGPDVVQQMDEIGITSLAQFYTSDLKYAPAAHEAHSLRLSRCLEDAGFLP